MNPFAVGYLVRSAINTARYKNPKYQKALEAFRQEVTAILEPDETLEAYCGVRHCVGVSDKRFFYKGKDGLLASIP